VARASARPPGPAGRADRRRAARRAVRGGGRLPGPDQAIASAAGDIAVPLRLDAGGTELAFFSTVATFGTAIDVTLAEPSIEAFFPADEATAAYLRG
jgi:hypothetical protein